MITSNSKQFVIKFDLLDAIAALLLELPAKNSRLILNRIEKEVVPAQEPLPPAGEVVTPDDITTATS